MIIIVKIITEIPIRNWIVVLTSVWQNRIVESSLGGGSEEEERYTRVRWCAGRRCPGRLYAVSMSLQFMQTCSLGAGLGYRNATRPKRNRNKCTPARFVSDWVSLNETGTLECRCWLPPIARFSRSSRPVLSYVTGRRSGCRLTFIAGSPSLSLSLALCRLRPHISISLEHH